MGHQSVLPMHSIWIKFLMQFSIQLQLVSDTANSCFQEHRGPISTCRMNTAGHVACDRVTGELETLLLVD